MVDRLRTALGADLPVVDLAGSLDVVVMAAVLEQLSLFITPDTGPMHLADAVGTPLVAIHGPSDPARWGPRSKGARVVRVDLPCSPCNRIRRPPDRCVGPSPRLPRRGDGGRGARRRGGADRSRQGRCDDQRRTESAMRADARLLVTRTDGGAREVALYAYLDAVLTERAEEEANRWVKALRALRVDGQTLRDRFVYRGDSLWWFAELYLHKGRAIVHLHRAILALERLIERERPAALRWIRGDRVAALLAPQVAARTGVTYHGPPARSWTAALCASARESASEARSTWPAQLPNGFAPHDGNPRGGRESPRSCIPPSGVPTRAEETYIGPVLARTRVAPRRPTGRAGGSRTAHQLQTTAVAAPGERVRRPATAGDPAHTGPGLRLLAGHAIVVRDLGEAGRHRASAPSQRRHPPGSR